MKELNFLQVFNKKMKIIFAFCVRIIKFVKEKSFSFVLDSPGLRKFNYLLNLKIRENFSFFLCILAERLENSRIASALLISNNYHINSYGK